MRKVKKIMALLLTLAMVMGLSLTAFAEETATITVTNITETTKLEILQVVKPDTKTETGWAFCNGADSAFKTAFGVEDNQTAIWMLIKAENSGVSTPEGINAASAEQISEALTVIGTSGGFKAFKNGSTVNSAGIYVIKATDTSSTTPYRYTNMSAYVGFEYSAGQKPSLKDITIAAKGSPTDIEKDITDPEDQEHFGMGDIIDYQVKSYMPFFNAEAENKSFKVIDMIAGADYYQLEETARVTIGGKDITKEIQFQTQTLEQDGVRGATFTVDFSKYINVNNSYGGKEIVITYQAKANGTMMDVQNTVVSHINDDEKNEDHTMTTSGWIKLIKTDEADSEKLAGAGFKVKKDGTEVYLTFTEISDGIYRFDPEGKTEEIFTAENETRYTLPGSFLEEVTISKGEVLIYGLDEGNYHFEETTAPEGYSINKDGVSVELKDESQSDTSTKEAIAYLAGTGKLKDTKLSSLPSTGGIGTTIFTIGGCVIMIAAAGLYFASRRKNETK